MKRLISMLVCLSIVLTLLIGVCGTAQAASAETQTSLENMIVVDETVEELPDGNILRITTYVAPVTPYGEAFTQYGAKAYVLCNKSGDDLWRFILNGTFAVNTGLRASCVAASYEYEIINNAWYFDRGETSYSGNKAFGTGVFKRKVLGIVVETSPCNLTLSCDAYGNFS